MVKVGVWKLRNLFGQNRGLLLDILNIIKEKKNGNQLGLFFVKKNIRGMSYTKCTGKKLLNHFLMKKI